MRSSAAARAGAAVPWVILLGLCAVVLTLLDAFLIGRSTDFFIGGFLMPEPHWTTFHFSAFFAASLVFDATLVLGIWILCYPLLRWQRLAFRQRLAVAALVGVGPPLAVLYVRYQLSRFLGDLIDTKILLALAGGSPLEWLAQGSAQILPVALALLAALAAAWLFVRALRAPGGARVGLWTPPRRDMLVCCALGVLVAGGVLYVARNRYGVDYRALARKNSGAVLTALYEHLTDFDFDGYGMFSLPIDQAPFDATIHPYAVDVPGNGIDENGLAGDHPVDFRAPSDGFEETPAYGRRPNVLVIFLEGVRADAVGQRLGQRVVMPFLTQLAADGAHSEHAYANSPYTALSRAQLMGGRLVPFGGQSTLIDDFHRNGYQVAWFSGQDESFGLRESSMLGQARADYHYDARDDRDHSVSIFRTSGSLAVSWKRVNERIAAWLDTRADPRPLLLYVNYGDTHFPYDHRELDDVLGVPRLSRTEITPERRDAVIATYANAAANVDNAIAQLVARWRTKLGPDGAILVTSDHGEALFEGVGLGHGLALDPAQTRVPLVVYGLGGDWPEPIGMSDLRGAVQRSLQSAGGPGLPRVHFAAVPDRRVLQYMAVIGEPRLLSLKAYDSEIRFDTAYGTPRNGDPEFDRMIWWWESLQAQAEADGRAP